MCIFCFFSNNVESYDPQSNLSPTILRFYDLTYPKRSKSFKDLCDCLGSVGSYNSDDPKRHWFLVIFFNLIEGLVGPK